MLFLKDTSCCCCCCCCLYLDWQHIPLYSWLHTEQNLSNMDTHSHICNLHFCTFKAHSCCFCLLLRACQSAAVIPPTKCTLSGQCGVTWCVLGWLLVEIDWAGWRCCDFATGWLWWASVTAGDGGFRISFAPEYLTDHVLLFVNKPRQAASFSKKARQESVSAKQWMQNSQTRQINPIHSQQLIPFHCYIHTTLLDTAVGTPLWSNHCSATKLSSARRVALSSQMWPKRHHRLSDLQNFFFEEQEGIGAHLATLTASWLEQRSRSSKRSKVTTGNSRPLVLARRFFFYRKGETAPIPGV